ncbi:right-handed parallel beta-helix repeat-containing protein [Clostridium estertheticum]|uniref:right-handed parallel beta-helix repeat-containing protein n=1 Tax=Clostridium estertheticum TaxID=238834 RepID=UPI001CF1D4E4|nr:right-handed parallel beta-helix repeat-containing protein [Clostridium estertheticum]MCB2356137.1 right-handed parallel beta-helix repeat-containing protein [Clostridium estertheticum]WAG43855.1 right-handed parallel beta-helix repeat-containing protein [Clostridium estertheticum]
MNTSGSTITDLEIYGAADNGIYMEGSSNRLTNLKVHGNHDAGVQLSNGAASNTLTNVYSYSNADAKGENTDGFAIKLHSGAENKLIDCTAEGNSDDGYDLYAAHGAVTFTRCKAINNGNCGGIKGDGNGFKVGGVDNKTPGVCRSIYAL